MMKLIGLGKIFNFVKIMCLYAGPSDRSPAEIVGSNPTGGMDVFLL